MFFLSNGWMYYKTGNFDFPILNILSLWLFSLYSTMLWSCSSMKWPISFLKLFDSLLMMILVLVNVAFITLMERKILGYSQLRLGPNKPAVAGLLQPMADAVKLFSNKTIAPTLISSLFNFMPFFSLAFILLLWCLIPMTNYIYSYSYSILIFLMILSVTVYPILLAGWSSNSKFSGLGAIRAVAQTISYEVALALLISAMMVMFSMMSFSENFLNLINLTLIPGLILIWLIVMLAETNRTPFDFAEGESELVSGFNTEYSSNKFAVVFMAEYASIYFLGAISALLFFNFVSNLSILVTIIFIFFWVWVRATLPRHRYDFLMAINWKKILPLVLSILSFMVFMYALYNKI